MAQITPADPALTHRLRVGFTGEAGIDAGGLSEEVLELVFHEAFSEDQGRPQRRTIKKKCFLLCVSCTLVTFSFFVSLSARCPDLFTPSENAADRKVFLPCKVDTDCPTQVRQCASVYHADAVGSGGGRTLSSSIPTLANHNPFLSGR